MKSIIFAGLALLSMPVRADEIAPGPNMRGCNYNRDDATQTAVALKLMPMTLPYLDNQRLSYFGKDRTPLGYSIRRGLRIYFYDVRGEQLGAAIRRTEERTAYFDQNGQFIGICLRHKMQKPNTAIPFDPHVDPNDQ